MRAKMGAAGTGRGVQVRVHEVEYGSAGFLRRVREDPQKRTAPTVRSRAHADAQKSAIISQKRERRARDKLFPDP